MKKITIILLVAMMSALAWNINSPVKVNAPAIQAATQPNEMNQDSDLFEEAVEIIKKYETLHKPKHWPLVGYGHKVMPGEKFSRTTALSELQADALLRKDLKKICNMFKDFGPDSLLLGVLAYNIGPGAAMRSSVAKKLRMGDRNIESEYLSYSRYKGKVHNQIRQRRIEEFDALYLKGKITLESESNDNLLTENNFEKKSVF